VADRRQKAARDEGRALMKDAFDRFAPPQRGRFGDNESAQPSRARVDRG
jgi:hypothetical protein